MIDTACYINNLGIINALGATKSEVAANLFSVSNDPNLSKMVAYDELFSGRKTYVGMVTASLQKVPARLAKFDCRNNQFLVTAYAEIEQDVEHLKQRYGAHRVAVILGTSTSGIASSEEAFKQYFSSKNLSNNLTASSKNSLAACHNFPATFNYAQQEIGSCSEFLAQYAGLTGSNYTISTACSSSAKTFIVAERLLRAGHCDAAIVGGSDSLCELTLNGFDSLDLISPSICNPFSANRSGLNIGEGAALFVLSREPVLASTAVRRGSAAQRAPIKMPTKMPIKLAGVGAASDGYHMTAPDPLGGGGKLAIRQALQAAKIAPADIGYVNLHGTGTSKNDAMEARVMHEIFGKCADVVYCSSTKPLLGHTLGVAGAHGVGLCWLLLSWEYNPEQLLPPQVWDGMRDPEFPPINLVTVRYVGGSGDTGGGGAVSSPVIKWQRPYFMSNSFAFGGSNVSLIISL